MWACGDLKPRQKPCHNSPNIERSRDYLVLKGARDQHSRGPLYAGEWTSSGRSGTSVLSQQVTFETKEAAEIPVIAPSASSEGVYHQFGFSVHGFALAI
jgi:hypothetical protein